MFVKADWKINSFVIPVNYYVPAQTYTQYSCARGNYRQEKFTLESSHIYEAKFSIDKFRSISCICADLLFKPSSRTIYKTYNTRDARIFTRDGRASVHALSSRGSWRRGTRYLILAERVRARKPGGSPICTISKRPLFMPEDFAPSTQFRNFTFRVRRLRRETALSSSRGVQIALIALDREDVIINGREYQV